MKKRQFLCAAALTVALTFTACAQEKPAQQPESESQTNAETTLETTTQSVESESKAMPANEYNKAYLAEYFGVAFDADVDANGFNEALKSVAGEEAPAVEGDLTGLTMIKAAVEAADHTELALSYPEEKVQERLAFHGIESEVDAAYAAYLACALDVELVDVAEAQELAKNEAVSTEMAEAVLMAVANANGDAWNFIGYSDDEDIYGKLDNAWNSFILFDDPALSEIGKTSVEKGITTGYNLKSSVYDAKFLSALTLQYGHSDIKHAHQLLGLLNSENIRARVQLEPKVSIFQYLLEWGPIPEPSPVYEVKQSGDLYLSHAVEYDLQLEFENEEEMLAFDAVIEKYAKKYEGNEEAVGLIAESWWQPLYTSTRTDMPEETYHEMYDCVIKNGVYSIHPFCLGENKDEVVEKLNQINPEFQVEPELRYCNTAFYNYLKGDDYQ